MNTSNHLYSPSPFTPGQVNTNVFGREQHIRNAGMLFAQTAQAPRLAARTKVFVGPRGVGKTSLLRALQESSQREGFDDIWITAGDGPLLAELHRVLLKKTESWQTKTTNTLVKLLQSVQVKWGPINATFASNPSPSASASAGRELQEILVAAVQAAMNANTDHNKGLVLYIDEVQLADPDGLRALAYAWQTMQSEHAELPLILFCAGLSHSQDVITKAASFAERFEYHHLGNLAPEDARMVLQELPLGKGVQWESAALLHALKVADGYPYFLQLIGDLVWQSAGYPQPGGVLTQQHYEQAALLFEQQQQSFFRARWTKATANEQDLLVALAQLGGYEVKRSEIAEKLQTTTQALSVPRASLIDKGIIEAVGHGHLSFTVPGFEDYVLEAAS